MFDQKYTKVMLKRGVLIQTVYIPDYFAETDAIIALKDDKTWKDWTILDVYDSIDVKTRVEKSTKKVKNKENATV